MAIDKKHLVTNDKSVNLEKQEKKLLKRLNNTLIINSNIKLFKFKPWISYKINNILDYNKEQQDDIILEYIFELLNENEEINLENLYFQLIDFLNKENSIKFVLDLYELLIEAQSSETGVAKELLTIQKDKQVIYHDKREPDNKDFEGQNYNKPGENVKRNYTRSRKNYARTNYNRSANHEKTNYNRINNNKEDRERKDDIFNDNQDRERKDDISNHNQDRRERKDDNFNHNQDREREHEFSKYRIGSERDYAHDNYRKR
ncbi:unnamed protein product [Candida verbasci]|uniref:U1 small nuclear ribonucleoprotein component SNU71 n=1 Tax=Candida verbasci TaxID=1227364 RepID=A0A9W4TZI5_9ASCO|nr:unnamed protein product [Candida verbasci]